MFILAHGLEGYSLPQRERCAGETRHWRHLEAACSYLCGSGSRDRRMLAFSGYLFPLPTSHPMGYFWLY